MRPSPGRGRSDQQCLRRADTGGRGWGLGHRADFPATCGMSITRPRSSQGLGHEAWSGRQAAWTVAPGRRPCTRAPSVVIAGLWRAGWWWRGGCRGACLVAVSPGHQQAPSSRVRVSFQDPTFHPAMSGPQPRGISYFPALAHCFFQGDLTKGPCCVRAAPPMPSAACSHGLAIQSSCHCTPEEDTAAGPPMTGGFWKHLNLTEEESPSRPQFWRCRMHSNLVLRATFAIQSGRHGQGTRWMLLGQEGRCHYVQTDRMLPG